MFPNPSGSRFAAAMLVVALASLSGCATPVDPPSGLEQRSPSAALLGPAVAPDGGTRDLFYPLAVGNRWNYLITFTSRLVPDSGPPEPPVTTLDTLEAELFCSTDFLGRSYVVQLE